jgi:N-formylglutamate deformylase
MNTPYHIIEPKVKKVPIILSVPHCGTAFPDELIADYKKEMALKPDDTDWFVHELYNFASELGITLIYAKYSRWVIDLNRDPESKALYNDGRIITGLTTTTDFFGNEIYISPDKIPNEEEIKRRLENYYWPYYQKISDLLEERKKEFGKVLLWDAHSIRRHVPTIQKDFFPDLILGDNDEKTAHQKLIASAMKNLSSGDFALNHNHPFKGGHITRYFGKPENNVHALQLEMNKMLYMDDTETIFDEHRANKMREILRKTFVDLIQTLDNLA